MDRAAPFVLLDDSRPGRERITLYRAPAAIVAADRPEEIAAALKALSRAARNGLHAAGYYSYEAGYALEPRLAPLMPETRSAPLLWFGLFAAREEFAGDDIARWFDARVGGRAYSGPLQFAQTPETYKRAFDSAKEYIAAGDVYQANLTFPARFAFAGDPLALYRRLREKAASAHGAYVFDGARAVLSFSPELFFAVSGREITARPMKGTAPRGRDTEDDERRRTQLQASKKDRAENLMIVDLIRNDVGRIAETGSVRVDDLFGIETYPTVHQMVSTVRATLRADTNAESLTRALFPCGSVTGTPKIRAMEILRALERAPRGLYCGGIGAFSPDGSAHVNVAIRTLTISGNEGVLGVGSAVVADSEAGSEYDECLLKSRYYSEGRRTLSLIETLRHDPASGFVRERLHLERMAESAAMFGIPFDRAAASCLLRTHVRTDGPSRMRLQLDEDGRLRMEAQPLSPQQSEDPWRYGISGKRVRSTDMLARHKTNWRTLYDEELARAKQAEGCDEVVFLNEREEVVEGSRTNIFIRTKGRLLTPPLSSGALAGCLRRELLETGACAEAALRLHDLEAAETVYFGNSLRGLVRAVPART